MLKVFLPFYVDHHIIYQVKNSKVLYVHVIYGSHLKKWQSFLQNLSALQELNGSSKVASTVTVEPHSAQRNRCSTGYPALKDFYCWGLKQNKCPQQAKGQDGQEAPGFTSLDLLNECNVTQCVGLQSNAESRPTCLTPHDPDTTNQRFLLLHAVW